MLQCYVCSPNPKVSELRGNRSEFHSERNYYLQNWYFSFRSDFLNLAHCEAVSASPEVPLNLVGLRTKLFMEFNLGRNSAPTLHGLTRAPELSRRCTVARFDDFFYLWSWYISAKISFSFVTYLLMFSIKTTLNPKLTELKVSKFVQKIVQKIFKTIVDVIASIKKKEKKKTL